MAFGTAPIEWFGRTQENHRDRRAVRYLGECIRRNQREGHAIEFRLQE